MPIVVTCKARYNKRLTNNKSKEAIMRRKDDQILDKCRRLDCEEGINDMSYGENDRLLHEILSNLDELEAGGFDPKTLQLIANRLEMFKLHVGDTYKKEIEAYEKSHDRETNPLAGSIWTMVDGKDVNVTLETYESIKSNLDSAMLKIEDLGQSHGIFPGKY